MAGIGSAPKDPSVRRNKTAPQRGEWVDLPPLAEPVLLALPARANGEKWSQRTEFTWEMWRTDPVTTQWSPADVAYALDTILLYEGMKPSTASEVRLRMDGLGLTPKGKRDLRWRIADVSEESAPRRATSGSSSRRARLSVVK